MDFTERFELYKEGGMITDEDIEDIQNVIALFRDEYGVVLEEENAAPFIAHLCAAYGRLVSKEPVDEIPETVLEELRSLDTYKESEEILEKVMNATKNPLNETEQGYALLHINNLIAQFKETGEWHTCSDTE
ncbi:MAG: PRD domain-containing protein [Erysipelotrichaceae bacterium]|nr:PRD domain-containing protein [Erysipelotrichaceae bacterium]